MNEEVLQMIEKELGSRLEYPDNNGYGKIHIWLIDGERKSMGYLFQNYIIPLLESKGIELRWDLRDIRIASRKLGRYLNRPF
jgi:hypothetical protein